MAPNPDNVRSVADDESKKATPTDEKKRAVEEKPKRPCSVYNLFYQLEREYIMQSVSPNKATSTSPDKTKSQRAVDPDLPDRYRHMALSPGWYVSGKKKRKHRKSNCVIGFKELNEMISSQWKKADDDIKAYCRAKYAEQWEIYKERLRVYEASQEKESKGEKTTAATKKRKSPSEGTKTLSKKTKADSGASPEAEVGEGKKRNDDAENLANADDENRSQAVAKTSLSHANEEAKSAKTSEPIDVKDDVSLEKTDLSRSTAQNVVLSRIGTDTDTAAGANGKGPDVKAMRLKTAKAINGIPQNRAGTAVRNAQVLIPSVHMQPSTKEGVYTSGIPTTRQPAVGGFNYGANNGGYAPSAVGRESWRAGNETQAHHVMGNYGMNRMSRGQDPMSIAEEQARLYDERMVHLRRLASSEQYLAGNMYASTSHNVSNIPPYHLPREGSQRRASMETQNSYNPRVVTVNAPGRDRQRNVHGIQDVEAGGENIHLPGFIDVKSKTKKRERVVECPPSPDISWEDFVLPEKTNRDAPLMDRLSSPSEVEMLVFSRLADEHHDDFSVSSISNSSDSDPRPEEGMTGTANGDAPFQNASFVMCGFCS